MNRRETIILAALVNAGLLLVLFATARHRGESPIAATPETSVVSVAPMDQPVLVATPTPEPLLEVAEADPVLSAAPMAAVTTPAVPPSTSYFVPQPPTPVTVIPTIVPPSEVEPVAARETPAAASSGTVTVKKGDVLERIARRNGTSVAQLMQVNGLTSTSLKIGQVLKLPAGSQPAASTATATATKSSPAAATTEGAAHYTVKQGDNPWLIANRNSIAVSELLRLNSLDEKSARRLKPGDKLRVR
jgi:peptidoglycan DL-endopeptidase LytF